MKVALIFTAVLAIAGAAVLLGLPQSRHLRGKAMKSPDGKTYLVVADTEGADCKLDDKRWPHKEGEQGAISPGVHFIECRSGKVGFEIPQGVVFHFDYWGP